IRARSLCTQSVAHLFLGNVALLTGLPSSFTPSIFSLSAPLPEWTVGKGTRTFLESCDAQRHDGAEPARRERPPAAETGLWASLRFPLPEGFRCAVPFCLPLCSPF